MLIDLRDKVAIVTGAGRGIGYEIARTLAAERAVVVVTDVRQDLLDAATAEWQGNGWRGAQLLCDVRSATDNRAVVEAVLAEFGTIDILVNNAGVASGAPIETLREEVWDLNMDINLKGMFLMCQAVVPTMKRQRSGRILNAASFAAIVPGVGGAAYAASKAGVVSMTRVLAGELGPWNVTVNAYAPGMIPTDMNGFAGRPAEEQARLLDTLTLRRWGSPADVANLVCFLASDLAGYITGATIDISGGKLATQMPSVAYRDIA
ncbi:MAG TPA: SDR family NAD(P)-dependent oxidoreductase [Devosiaceae bacterium]|jgi:3-oxoacyl-[acyl-carrier protein] reductase|nr:SDR family NAD(P)-dependent oxidoreductase [Devosiaceae bacterium]